MHSKIFQISNKPIDKDDYMIPDDFYDERGIWYDYIGDAVEDEEDRHDYIKGLAGRLEGVFTLNKDWTLTYKGREALDKFLDDWADYLRRLVGNLSHENILREQNLWKVRHAATDTHKESSYRFYIEDWNGYAAAFEDMIDYAANQLKQGDRIYVGAVIDYHF